MARLGGLREGWWHNLNTAQRRGARGFMLVLAMVAAVYLPFQARYGLFDVDEAVFTQATLEMRGVHDEMRTEQSGQGSWAMPTYNGEPRYHKPPLIYWLQAGAMEIFGDHSLWGARLPSALFGFLTVALLGAAVWRFTKQPRYAVFAMAALGFNLSFTVVARAATADAVLNFFSLALVVCVLRQLYGAPWRWGPVLTGAVAALGLLAKGPIAGVPAFIVFATLVAVRPDRAALWARLRPWATSAFMLLGLIPWVVLMAWQGGWMFFYDFIVVHNLQRFGEGFSNTQSNSPLYYLLVILVGFLPWVFFLPRAVTQLAHGFVGRLRYPSLRVALPALALVWAVAYVLFFSFSATKLAHYIVPAYPALALVVGWWLAEPEARKGFAADVLWVGPLLVVLAGVFALLNPLLLGLRDAVPSGLAGWLLATLGVSWPPNDPVAVAVLALPVVLNPAPWIIALLLLGAVLPAWVLAVNGKKGGVVVLGVAMAAVLGLVVHGVVPVVYGYTQAPLAMLARDIKAAPVNMPIIHLGLHKPSVLYLSGRPFVKLEKPLQLPEYLPPGQTVLVLTEQDKVKKIQTEMAVYSGSNVKTGRCLGGYCWLLVDKPAITGAQPALQLQ